jgi:hypothetical protein
MLGKVFREDNVRALRYLRSKSTRRNSDQVFRLETAYLRSSYGLLTHGQDHLSNLR